MSDKHLHSSQEGQPRVAKTLGLRVPDQLPPPADSFLLDPRDTEKWLAALPMANIGETARQVFRSLVDFNRYQLPEMLRAKLVEQFRDPVNYICTNLKRHYLDSTFPISEKGWKTANLSRELYAELAISYKILIERMLAGQADRFDRKLLVIATHRAMHYLGRVMLQTAVIYAPWPKGIWKELNTLYRFAQQNHVHRTPVKMHNGDSKSVTTIEEQYKGLLLIAAATPYRLRQHNIVRLYDEVFSWANLTDLSAADEMEPGNGKLALNLLADEPPVHTNLRAPNPDRQSLVLDARRLVKKLHQDFESAPWENTSDVRDGRQVLTRPLLRQLIIALNQPPDRRFVRTQLNFELNVVVGLAAIHDNVQRALEALSSRQSGDMPNASGSPFQTESESELLSPYSLNTDSQLTNLNYQDMSIAPLDEQSLSTDSAYHDSLLTSPMSSSSMLSDDWQDTPVKAVKPRPTRTPVKTRNESAGGYCIRWSNAIDAPKIKVGELVGIASSTHKHQYSLGVVRWLRMHGGRELDLGLQIISRSVEAGQLRQAGQATVRRSANAPTDCLLLPVTDNDPNSDSASLILSGASFSSGTDLWLNQSGGERRIRLTKLIEFNNAFVRYAFAFTGQSDAEDSDTGFSGSNFDDLWTSL